MMMCVQRIVEWRGSTFRTPYRGFDFISIPRGGQCDLLGAVLWVPFRHPDKTHPPGRVAGGGVVGGSECNAIQKICQTSSC